MHVLGHSFSQKRKSTKRPRDLHIRKVSFSGSSLSSGSFSSSSSTSTLTPRNFSPSRDDGSLPVDPLHLHPTFQAPARLNERPLIRTESPRWQEGVSFFDLDTEDEDDFDDDELHDGEDEYDDEFAVKPQGLTCRHQPPEMALPPHASPLDHSDQHEASDYFLSQLTKRPPMPRSRWSESTIQTLDSIAPSTASGTAIADIPNFSYKRNTVPKRPTMKSADSVDNFIKRGGWKRRGIVFHNEEMKEEVNDNRGSAFTL